MSPNSNKERIMRNGINLDMQTEDDVHVRFTRRADDIVLQMNSDRTLLTLEEADEIFDWLKHAVQSD